MFLEFLRRVARSEQVGIEFGPVLAGVEASRWYKLRFGNLKTFFEKVVTVFSVFHNKAEKKLDTIFSTFLSLSGTKKICMYTSVFEIRAWLYLIPNPQLIKITSVSFHLLRFIFLS